MLSAVTKMTSDISLPVPDVLGGRHSDTEQFLTLVSNAQPGQCITLNMSAVGWIRPHGAVLLLDVCRYLAELAHQPVRLVALRRDVHSYLRRIDFFERVGQMVYTTDSFDSAHDMGRSASSANILELVPVLNHLDVFEVGKCARKILGFWLGSATYDIDQIVNLLAEACGNVVDHSGDHGTVTIQKYDYGSHVEVELAIADMGIGIRRSLMKVHGDLSDTSCGYIERALGGLSARKSGRGGHGLGTIQRIAIESGGSLYLRSESGAVSARPLGTTPHDFLSFFPGTQISVTFRSRA